MTTLDVSAARAVLPVLAGVSPPEPLPDTQVAPLAEWLMERDLGPLAHHIYRATWPELATCLQTDYFAATAENGLLFALLERVLSRLNAAGIPAVLLKGAALAPTVYPAESLRLMSDVDVWVRPADAGRTWACLRAAGLVHAPTKQVPGVPHSPTTPPLTAHGKIEMKAAEWAKGGVDVHTVAFAGHWLRHTAAVDEAALWQRAIAFEVRGQPARRLAAVDAILHAAAHVGVNHQFDATTLRALIDIARLAQAHSIDWASVLQRARRWRIATAVWFALYFAAALLDLPDLPPRLQPYRPSPLRQRLLLHLVSPATILTGHRLNQGRTRYLFLLLLVDRPLDALKLALYFARRRGR